jgi:hypothetical protein
MFISTDKNFQICRKCSMPQTVNTSKIMLDLLYTFVS